MITSKLIRKAADNPKTRDAILRHLWKASSSFRKAITRLAKAYTPQEIKEQVENAGRLSNVDPQLAKVLSIAGTSHDKVNVSHKNLPADKLKPSQTTMVLPKSVGMALAMLSGKLNTDLGAIVSKDGFIMDGHHRWSAAIIAFGPGVQVGGYVADLPGNTLLRVLNLATKGWFQGRNGNPGTGSINSYTPKAVESLLREYLETGAPNSFSAAQIQALLIEEFGSIDVGVATMAKNVTYMSKKIPSWAPDRKDMPVIEPNEVPGVAKNLSKGLLKWKAPYQEIDL